MIVLLDIHFLASNIFLSPLEGDIPVTSTFSVTVSSNNLLFVGNLFVLADFKISVLYSFVTERVSVWTFH